MFHIKNSKMLKVNCSRHAWSRNGVCPWWSKTSKFCSELPQHININFLFCFSCFCCPPPHGHISVTIRREKIGKNRRYSENSIDMSWLKKICFWPRFSPMKWFMDHLKRVNWTVCFVQRCYHTSYSSSNNGNKNIGVAKIWSAT